MQYRPGDPPLADLEQLRLYVRDELWKLAEEVNLVKQLSMVKNPASPQRFARGDIYYFDAGVVGLVEGPYFYDGTKWHFMGDYPPAYGGLYFNTNKVVSFAANTWLKIAVYDQQAAAPVDVLQNMAQGTITVQRSGLYGAQGFIDFLNPAPNQQWSIAFFKNNALAPITEVRVSAKDNGDGVNLNTVITSPLVAGDVVDVRLKNTVAQANVTLITGLLSLVQQQ